MAFQDKKPIYQGILYDVNGNPVGVTLDGAVYRLETEGKVLNSSGAQIDPATEAKLETVRALLASIKDTDGIKKITDGIQLQASANGFGSVKLEDGSSTRKAYIDESFRLAVSANVVVPPTSVAVNIQVVSNLNGTSDDVYVIPNGKTLTVSRFAGGAEGNRNRGSVVSLYYDPNGNGVGMTLIRMMFLGTSNWEFSLDNQFVGDGTAAIRMRRDRLDNGADFVAGFWDGFRDA